MQHILAFDLLLRAGRFSGFEPLSLFDRIPLRAPLTGNTDCQLRNLILVEREDGPQEFQLPSGLVILVGLTAVTDAELEFAKAHGSPALIERLRAVGYHPVTNPTRASVAI